jgi:hypothetical protein
VVNAPQSMLSGSSIGGAKQMRPLAQHVPARSARDPTWEAGAVVARAGDSAGGCGQRITAMLLRQGGTLLQTDGHA